MKTKICRSCKTRKDISKFYAHGSTKDRVQLDCKKCVIANSAKRAKADPLWRFGKNLKRKYWKHLHWRDALTEYDRLFRSQNGVCAVCKNPETKAMRGKVRTLCVDHCHRTGKIRALLCDSCNIAEGCLKTPEIAAALVKYMRRHL